MKGLRWEGLTDLAWEGLVVLRNDWSGPVILHSQPLTPCIGSVMPGNILGYPKIPYFSWIL